MDLKHLRSFIAVAEELSFRKAAERQNLTTPPFSLQIKNLEEEIGVKLLERGRNKKISLTVAGKLFLEDARSVVQAADKAFSGVRNHAEGRSGQIRIGFTDDFLFGGLSLCIAQMLENFPEVNISSSVGISREIIRQLDVGDLDIGLTCFPIQRLDPRFTIVELPPIRIVAVLHDSHPLSTKEEIWLHELKTDPVILMPMEIFSGFSAHVSRLYAHAQITPTPLAFSQNSVMMMQIIAAGQGILLASETSIPSSWPGIRIVHLKDDQPYVDAGLIFNTSNTSRIIIDNFRKIVENVFHRAAQ